jgi:hypothetical protein
VTTTATSRTGDPCPRCGTAVFTLDALGILDGSVRLCGCWRAYNRADLGGRPCGTPYCIAADCGCKPAGRSAGHGALTGRARWWLAIDPRNAPGTEVTLCGGCYRRVRHVVPRIA